MTKFIRLAALVATSTACVAAQATITFNISQNGSDVLLTASGSLDLDAVTKANIQSGYSSFVRSGFGEVSVGATKQAQAYHSAGAGFTDFGSGTTDLFSASSTSGDDVFFEGANGTIDVPLNYVSGTALSGSSTFLNTTLADLELNSGVYTYNFIAGIHADSVVVNIGQSQVSGVPEPTEAALLVAGLGLVGIGARRRRAAKAA